MSLEEGLATIHPNPSYAVIVVIIFSFEGIHSIIMPVTDYPIKSEL